MNAPTEHTPIEQAEQPLMVPTQIVTNEPIALRSAMSLKPEQLGESEWKFTYEQGAVTLVLTVTGADPDLVEDFRLNGRVGLIVTRDEGPDIDQLKAHHGFIPWVTVPIRTAEGDASMPRIFTLEFQVEPGESPSPLGLWWIVDPSVNSSNDQQDKWQSTWANPQASVRVTTPGKVKVTGIAGYVTRASGFQTAYGTPFYVTWAQVTGNTSPVGYSVTGGGYIEV
jgi:hypothetical protein